MLLESLLGLDKFSHTEGRFLSLSVGGINILQHLVLLDNEFVEGSF